MAKTQAKKPKEREETRGRGEQRRSEAGDLNFAAAHPDVGNEDKAGKSSASGDLRSHDQRDARSAGCVRDIMSPVVEVCTPETELYYVARMMADRDVGAIPVVESTDSMKPVGIITDRDIVVRALARRQDPSDLCARDCMSSGVVTCTPNDDLDACTDKMEREQVRRIVVVDHTGRCVGIVAQADIAMKTEMATAAELVREVSIPDGAAEQRRYH